MNLRNKRKVVSSILNAGLDRIWFDEDRLEDIKAAITREDLRNLIKEGVIRLMPIQGVSRGRARKIKIQKSKGRRKGPGSRKGASTARKSRKERWMDKIRTQRKFFKELIEKELIEKSTYRFLRMRAKGGFFRSKRHIKLYLEDKSLFLKKNGK